MKQSVPPYPYCASPAGGAATTSGARSRRLTASALAGLWLTLSVWDAQAGFRAGLATADITPPVGMPMAGYYHERGADGVLDPLLCKALVLESEGRQVALITVDTIEITREITDQARAQIEQTVRIPGAQVMISATHAHTGPALVHPGGRSPALGGNTDTAVAYTRALPGKIAEATRKAAEALQPVQLSRAVGRCEGLAFNRRFYMRDGSVGWNPGRLNPDIALPAGTTDPAVGILYLAQPESGGPDRSLGTYVNFAMHPDTCGGSKFSADWPGAVGRVLAAYHGPHHLTLVANGTCGNLNHFDVNWKWPGAGAGEQNRIATILGAAIFQAYKDLKPVAAGALRVKSEWVELPVPDISAKEVEEAKQVLATTKDDSGANFMRLVRAYRAADIGDRQGKPFRVEVQAVALGQDLAWVSLPGEVFVELGLAIKKRSPFPQTFVIELGNEDIGYIPDRRSFAEGNYEPESARCAPGSGERLVEAAARLLTALRTPEKGIE